MAKRGDYLAAVEAYDDLRSEFPGLAGFDYPSFNTVVMGRALMDGRRDVFDRFYTELPDFKRTDALRKVLVEFRNETLHLDDTVAALVVAGDPFHRGADLTPTMRASATTVGE